MALRFDVFGSATGARAGDSDDELAHLDDPARNVRLSDRRLVEVAMRATTHVDWDLLADCITSGCTSCDDGDGDSAPSITLWKPPSDWTPYKYKPERPRVSASSSRSIGSTRIFTRERRARDVKALASTTTHTNRQFQSQPQTRVLAPSFAVLAHATIACSLHELRLALEATTTAQFSDMLQAVMRDDVRSSELVHAAATETRSAAHAPPDLLVKAVAFEPIKRLFRNSDSNSDEWCYLDFMQHVAQAQADNTDNRKTLRKTFVTLDPEDLFVGSLPRSSRCATQARDVVAGLLLEERADGRATRVAFSAEHFYTNELSSSQPRHSPLKRVRASKATVQLRLLRIASSLERLGAIARRRRLGVQVLVDPARILSQNTECVSCRRAFNVFVRKQLCDLCGYRVCDRCSALEDRERCCGSANTMRVDRVRVCDKCVVSLDASSYDDVTLASLKPARVEPDASPTPALGSALAALLQTEISDATSQPQRLAVHTLIDALVSNSSNTSVSTYRDAVSSAGTGTGITTKTMDNDATPESSEIQLGDASSEDAFATLTKRLEMLRLQLDAVPPLTLAQCVVAHADKRSYRNEHPRDPTGAILYVLPPPEREAKRLAVVRANGFADMLDVAGLDAVCAIARKRLGCVGTMIAVVEQDFYHAVATDMALPTRRFPRHEGFCSRTVLDDAPLFVPHLQADVRFSYMHFVAQQHLGFYCGFPLLAGDDGATVIGSLCCAGLRTKKLTRSEFVIAKRLAQAAATILQNAAGAARYSTNGGH